jgi:hypothetical protein
VTDNDKRSSLLRFESVTAVKSFMAEGTRKKVEKVLNHFDAKKSDG